MEIAILYKVHGPSTLALFLQCCVPLRKNSSHSQTYCIRIEVIFVALTAVVAPFKVVVDVPSIGESSDMTRMFVIHDTLTLCTFRPLLILLIFATARTLL